MSYNNSGPQGYREFDPESGDGLGRKKSLIRPERTRINQNHPRYHYTQVTNQESHHIKVLPSSTGLDPIISNEVSRSRSLRQQQSVREDEDEGIPLMDIHNASPDVSAGTPVPSQRERESSTTRTTSNDDLKGGREVYGLNDEFKGKHKNNVIVSSKKLATDDDDSNAKKSNIYFWKVYCYAITFWAPPPLMRLFGLKTKERQFAWREKMGLISCIIYVGAFVAYLTFGFTRTVCSGQQVRTRINEVSSGSLIINGRSFDLTHSRHPPAANIPAGSNILYPPTNAGGMDASMLFQNVNGNCKNLIVPRDNCTIPHDDDNNLAWYMPCRLFDQDGSTAPNMTEEYYAGYACHTSPTARQAYYNLKVAGDVYFTWDDIRNSSRNLVVYSGNVLDLNLLDWIQSDDVTYPDLFTKLRNDNTYQGLDISLVLTDAHERQAARCLSEIIKVGTVDSDTIGCIASQIVLYVSLVFILSVVFVKFVMALWFRWVTSQKQGATEYDKRSMASRNKDIENWTRNDNMAIGDQIKTVPVKARANYRAAKTNRQNVFNRAQKLSLAPTSDLSQYYDNPEALSKTFRYTTMSTQAALLGRQGYKKGGHNTRKQSTLYLTDQGSSTDLLNRPMSTFNPFDGMDGYPIHGLSPDIIHPDIIPQPPVEYQPFAYPLVHTMTLVTCYSEDEEGIRTTLDSIATTDYPNSHKLIVVICDGIIKGSGNDETTPDIVLGMMQDLTIPKDEVKAYSYVAVAQGSKRHNMAKVYAGFYKYDDDTIPQDKQQRVPMITIVKCGAPEEAGAAKPGNRGKRDSQIILMSFLQKVVFDERMTSLEYEILQNIWRVTGLMTEFYEIVLMVDADTRVYPDSLTHMVAEMVKDPSIMGLCGETKISNKLQSWVTAIQVFEYYISHHQAKAFESIFGGVTCLPGCFCMYRIKAPKGSDGYWVPILANPDIVERYSDNVVDTLHRKNLLLLGEDRYLSSLMLRTFPKRKQVFVPKAACKTIVPDKFKVLLSQRRRWINSTVHNLMELVLVNDLCGTFCFSMQFVIFIELVGTLVLPAAITFTFYVVVVAIISKPTPIMSLVLLGVIFGLPGLLIVITISSLSYIFYFFVYLFALPIWNFVLPSYAFWKFDDFSWGETRTVAGGDKGDHSTVEGKFDPSKIVMKRWREWERDRRNDESRMLAGAVGNNLSIPSAAWNPANSNADQVKEDYSQYSSSGSN
ncbi:chitin-UDP acetyl-glucosaminyl transferase 3 [Spathaspora passalidarum NRRL Y-27907]|uniref:chitin synthase n=1 Tax=Spathaspora passalidarum (strain NRRL Y-27907 / 11-Y1) TaxID=619300 RepID=G3AN85_SPAPN|nr:chitin-UDP acetyl-glucosaminyl transferase 3 [Spathaspora passalidarum NRRL Y-27907]EGW32468.1 chitin-UDP acetyl-glucosaminyl transferase 3 [Spathaspora passalidarum NRRL Y-27907]